MLQGTECLGIEMNQGDYGEILPITFSGIEILKTDKIFFIIKENCLENSKIIIEDIYYIENNVLNLQFNEEQSEKLKSGKYNYSIIWQREKSFSITIVDDALFVVK